jgi:hypothetical protein
MVKKVLLVLLALLVITALLAYCQSQKKEVKEGWSFSYSMMGVCSMQDAEKHASTYSFDLLNGETQVFKVVEDPNTKNNILQVIQDLNPKGNNLTGSSLNNNEGWVFQKGKTEERQLIGFCTSDPEGKQIYIVRKIAPTLTPTVMINETGVVKGQWILTNTKQSYCSYHGLDKGKGYNFEIAQGKTKTIDFVIDDTTKKMVVKNYTSFYLDQEYSYLENAEFGQGEGTTWEREKEGNIEKTWIGNCSGQIKQVMLSTP